MLKKLFSKSLLGVALIMAACSVFSLECVITGCNDELCSDIVQPRVGICVWKPEYQCYHEYGVCQEIQPGNCGWVQSPELVECLQKLTQEMKGNVPY